MERNYGAFMEELTRLTRKHGVTIQSTGGVFVASSPNDYRQVTYIADMSSGDLIPVFPES
ncbi:MAG: hypothetical protein HQL82_15735 [Magnetococcales bacterium]|nr:hypothetical protein [Magnetococcales bacterium]